VKLPNDCYCCVGRIVPVALGCGMVTVAAGGWGVLYIGRYMKCFSTHMLRSWGFRWGGINGECRGRRSQAASRRRYSGCSVGGSVMGEVTSSRRHSVLPSSQSAGEAVCMLWLFVSVRVSFRFLTALFVVILTIYIRVLVRTSHMFVVLWPTIIFTLYSTASVVCQFFFLIANQKLI
jgi:hypothetical protein